MDPRKPPLPYELWLDVASYLPDSLLKKLLNLNSVFLSLGLGVKYRYIALFGDGKKSREETIKYLEHLSQPYIRKRIIVFEINSRYTGIYDLTPQLSEDGGAGLAHAISSMLGGSPSAEVQAVQTIHQLSCDLVANLPTLRSLVICDAGLNSPLCFSLASSLWKLQIQNAKTMTMRHLVLSFIPDDIDRLIPICPSNHAAIHCLKSLHLRILNYGIYRPPIIRPLLGAYNTMRLLLEFVSMPAPCPPLFERHGGELINAGPKQLSFEFMASRTQQRFFDAMMYTLSSTENSLPNLTHFSVTTAPSALSDYQGTINFLNAYKSQITHLRILTHTLRPRSYINVVGTPFTGFAPPTMSALESLEMSGLRIDPVLAIQNVQAYVLQSTERLTSLIINDAFPLHFSHLKEILLVFPSRREPPPTSYHNVVLHMLRLNLLTLTSRHFDILVDHLPHLRELDIRIAVPSFPFRGHEDNELFIGRALDICDRSTLEEKECWQEEFWNDLQGRVFEGWELEVIRIRPTGVKELVAERMRQMLRTVVPSLLCAEVGSVG